MSLVVTACGGGGGGGGGGGTTPPPAQQTTGTIQGFVGDAFGAAVDSVSIALDGSQLGSVGGSFEVTNAATGTRQLRFVRDGYVPQTVAVSVFADSTTTIDVQLEREILPAAYSIDARVLATSSTSMTFELAMVVADSAGVPVQNLTSSSFQLDDFTSGGSTLEFSQDNFFYDASSVFGLGAYSALLMFDQSGSITSTDPTDARLFAGKTFLAALGLGDTVKVAAFSSGGSLPFSPVTTYGDYSNDGSSFFGTLDQLANLEEGSTPLYDAIQIGANDIFSSGTSTNRALIVFSDGDDTSSSTSLDEAVNLATSLGIRVFTVGLSDQIDRTVLLDIAAKTGGSFLEAVDARQLVAYYGTLGGVLNGNEGVYRAQWTASVTAGSFMFGPGASITTSVAIDTPSGTVRAPFKIIVP